MSGLPSLPQGYAFVTDNGLYVVYDGLYVIVWVGGPISNISRTAIRDSWDRDEYGRLIPGSCVRIV